MLALIPREISRDFVRRMYFMWLEHKVNLCSLWCVFILGVSAGERLVSLTEREQQKSEWLRLVLIRKGQISLSADRWLSSAVINGSGYNAFTPMGADWDHWQGCCSPALCVCQMSAESCIPHTPAPVSYKLLMGSGSLSYPCAWRQSSVSGVTIQLRMLLSCFFSVDVSSRLVPNLL